MVSPVSLCFLCPRPLFPTFCPQPCLLSPHTPSLTSEAGAADRGKPHVPAACSPAGGCPGGFLATCLSGWPGPPLVPHPGLSIPSPLASSGHLPPGSISSVYTRALVQCWPVDLSTLMGMYCVCVAQDSCPQLHVSSVTEDLNF